MPATEQTWWNLRLLHVVFAATAVTLLAATVFVLTGDHNRPWKQYAREFRELETWNAQARIDEQDSKAYEARRGELEAALGDARRADLDGDMARAFSPMRIARSCSMSSTVLVECLPWRPAALSRAVSTGNRRGAAVASMRGRRWRIARERSS